MNGTSQVLLTDDDKSEQQFRAIAMSNRVTVAKIKLKRADKLSGSYTDEIKEIDDSIVALTDELIIGDDVKSSLDRIENRVKALETGI